jgi:hypothetical protein
MPKGGARPGAGRKPKALCDKIAEKNPGHRPHKVLEFEGERRAGRPECPAYLREKPNKSGSYPNAEEVFTQVVDWLETTGCLHLIPPDYIAEYTLLKVRWLETEARTDFVGFLGKHPINGAPTSSPIIKAGIEYLKAAQVSWEKIWRIVAQNSEKNFRFDDPNTSVMSALLAHGAQKAPPKQRKKKGGTTDGADEHSNDPSGATESGEI